MKQFTNVNKSSVMVTRWSRAGLELVAMFSGVKSMMSTVRPRFTHGSILSRICLVSLIWLVVGGFSTSAWGQWTSKLTAAASPEAGGGVCASKSDHSTLEDSDYGPTSTSGGQYCATVWSSATFYAFYKANPGYKFVNWSTGATSWKISVTANKNDKNPYVTANFAPIDYTIRFYGNGSNGGSTASLAMKYATAQNLTVNGYTRSYSVTYDENGGSTVADATSTYTFASWNRNADGSGASYTDEQSVNNLTTTDGDYIDLYAQWTSASVTLPNATKDGAVLDGWYSGNTKIGDPGDAYTPTANITLTANWIAKYDFEITGGNYTINNEAWTQTTAFNFVHADEEHMTTTIEKTDVISYNRGSNTITALKIGTSKITFTQNTSSTVNNGTLEWTITVDSVANNLAVSNTSFTRFVEQDIANVRSGENSNGTISTTSTNPNLAHYNIATNTIEIPNSNAQKLPFEDVTITISQAPTAKYKAKKHTITLTVQKYTNTLTCSWGSWSKNVGFDSETGVTFSSNNDTGTSIDVTPAPVSDIATYDGTNHKIVANYRDGSASWTVSQDEDYKYVGDEVTCSVIVGTSSTECYVLDDSELVEWATVGRTKEYSVNGAADSLKFQARRVALMGVSNNQNFFAEYSTTTGDDNWNRLSPDLDLPNTDTWYDFAFDVPENTKRVRMRSNTGATGYRCIQNVKVTRLSKFDLEDEGGSEISSITLPSRTFSGGASTGTFYIDYSTCADKVKLVSNNEHVKFTESNSTTYEFDVENGTRKAIGLTYTSAAAETIAATITVYTPYEHKTLTVNAETKGKLATHLVYMGHASYPVDTTNIPVADLFEVRDENNDVVAGATITLGTSDPAKVAIDGTPNSIDPICSGTVTITASYGGDNTTYAAALNLEQSITINKINDEVSFVNGKSVVLKDDEYTLSGWASALSGTAITYTSSNEAIIKVEDGKLKVLAKGTATLTATSEGNCVYNSGSKTLKIKVRNADDPCETLLLDKPDKLSINLYTGTVANYTIADGPQDKLTFKVWKVGGATWNANVYIKNANGTQLKKFQYESGSLSADEPTDPNVEIDLTDAELAGAKTIEIDGSGTLYKYISDLKVSQKSYLTASTSSVTMSAVKACVESSGEFTVAYSDLSRIHLDHKNAGFRYEVWEGGDSIGNFDNDCGEYGTYTIKCFCTPEAKGEFKDSVFLSAAGQRDTIVVSGTADKADRSIAWNIPNGNNITATQTIQLTAKAYTACDTQEGGIYYTYESTTPDAATIDGDYITFHKQATVTVTAHTSPSDYYYDAVIEPYKTWAVGKVGTQMRRLPTITSTITYGDTKSVVTYDNDSWCAEDVLSLDSVPGTIAYVGPDNFTAAGPTNLSFNFTPSDLSVYDAQPFTVQVTVQKMAALEENVPLSICAGESVTYRGTEYSVAGTYPVNAEGDNRDTVYNVIVTVRQPSVGAESMTITAGDNESWNGIDLSGYAVGSHSVVAVLTNAVGCDSTVTLTLTVEAPVNEFTNAKGNGDWEDPDNWTSVPTGDTPDVIVSGELVIVDTISVGSLTIEPTGDVTVIEKGLLTVNGVTPVQNGGYGDIHVLNDGALALGESANLKVRNFTLDAKLGGLNTESEVKEHAASGQVDGANQLSVNGVVYFQISLDPLGYITYGWYDFTVPFEVNINGGIQRVNSSSDKVMVSGSDFIIMEADEVNRANGGNGWRKLNSGVLQPGKLYTISLDDEVNQNTLRFTWNGNGTLENGASYATQCEAGSVETLRGWNGLGNGMLNHGHLTTNYKKQVYNHGAKTYEVIYDERTFAVGTAFFIQVPEAGSVLWEAGNATEDRPLSAPKREAVAVEEFHLTLTAENEDNAADQLWVSASEEATGEYTIGHDLLKMGTPTSAKVAQMWTTRDNMKLCDIEMPLTSNKANTNLSLYAPKAGVYELAIQRAPADATLYLTQNNRVIWNLSMSPYDLDLTKGTTEGYGLRIVAQTPQISTDIENGGLLNGADGVRKVLIDNVLYIVTPEGKMYDIVGKGMKF